MSIDTIKTLVSNDIDAVDSLMKATIETKAPLIASISSHILDGGGKRIRPMLVVLSSQLFGYQGNAHHKLGAVVEFFHTATLLHDDVIDESTLRRGKSTAHMTFGNKASILVGDFLFTQAVQFLVELGSPPIFALMSDTAHEITEGEIRQLMNRGNLHLTESDYFDIIRAKTALLFQACMAMGGLLTNQSTDVIDALKYYGLLLGEAFQLIDDVLDYTGDESTTGKHIGDDLRDKKLTLPIIQALAVASSDEKKIIYDLFQSDDHPDVGTLLAIINKYETLDYAKHLAKKRIDTAIEALQIIPDSPYKSALSLLATGTLNRLY
jgi:octaprenyl-diphosphate synthase